MLRAAIDDVRAELQAAEDEARQQARRLRLRRFGGLADELETHAVALHETADAIAAQLESLPPPSA
jgi:hypothetical protein